MQLDIDSITRRMSRLSTTKRNQEEEKRNN